MSNEQLLAMQQQIAAELAARNAGAGTPAAVKGKGAKVQPIGVHAGLAAAGEILAQSRVQAPAQTRPEKASICGVKSDGTGTPCPKCAGAFNAVLHYSIAQPVPLDGGPAVTPANWRTKHGDKARVFVGLSADPSHAGKLVLIGVNHQAVVMDCQIAAALKAVL